MCEQSFGEGYCYCCNRCQVYKEICRWGIYNLWYAGVQDLMPKYVFAVGDIHKAFHEFLMEGQGAKICHLCKYECLGDHTIPPYPLFAKTVQLLLTCIAT